MFFLLPGEELPLWGNVLYFALTAIGVWLAGSRLSRYVDAIAERTGIGRVFAGALLLGAATSLPEIATTVTAATRGMGTIAASNLLGGVPMQIAVLAIADWFALRGRALTFFAPTAATLMQAVVLITMLALCIAAIAVGEVSSIAHVGLWTIGLAVAYCGTLYIIYRYEQGLRWEPTSEVAPEDSPQHSKQKYAQKLEELSSPYLTVAFVLACSVVLACGSLVAISGEALAAQLGLSQGIVGALLIAFATSLPEISTTVSAIRLGAYSMAAANIIGTNSLEIALLLPADLCFTEGLIINQIGLPGIFLATLGILTTCGYLWGMLERRDRTFLGMGVDSALVLVVYLSGIAIYAAFF